MMSAVTEGPKAPAASCKQLRYPPTTSNKYIHTFIFKTLGPVEEWSEGVVAYLFWFEGAARFSGPREVEQFMYHRVVP
jgi:hypothetical protein